MKVLLIDDSNFSLSMIKNQLSSLLPDAEIFSSTNPAEGLEIFDTEKPHLVVTDLLMPEITGESIVKHIRSHQSDCFICVASANIQTSVQDELLELGADLFIEKPINPSKIHKLLDHFNQRFAD